LSDSYGSAAIQRAQEKLDAAKAKDGFEQVTDPADHLKTAQNCEVAGDKARAMDAYKAAAAGFRLKHDTLGIAQAEDGIAACNVFARSSSRYDHPGRGKVRVCDSADTALRTALERTRAGEAVSVAGKRVLPVRGRAGDTTVWDGKRDKMWYATKHGMCEKCKVREADKYDEATQSWLCASCAKKKAKDATTPEGRELRGRIREIKAQISGSAGIDLKRSDPARYAALEKELTERLDQASDVQPVGDEFHVVVKGGSIGSSGPHVTSTHATREEAAEKAKRMNKLLSPGEKKYYGLGYSVKEQGK
jgi:ribosomal protein L37AE/L43A